MWPSGVVLVTTVLAAAIGFGLGAAWRARRDKGRLANLADLREQLEASETRRRRDEAQLAGLMTAVGEAVLVLDADRRVIAANGNAAEWFGVFASSDSFAPLSVVAALRSADAQELADVALAGESGDDTLVIGDIRYAVSTRPLAGGGAIMTLRDVSAIERLSRARRDLVANVSHDLRTPLTSITLLAEAMQGDASRHPKQVRSLAGQVRDQVAGLAAMADSLVELNQIESGRALFRLQAQPLARLVKAATERLALQLSAAGLGVDINIADDVMVLADRPYAERLFTNLLDNALRFAPAGTRVTIGAGTTAEPDRVEVTVHDEGPGIAPVDMDRIFERFYRSDRARQGGGSGLGLAISRHIVEGHGGRIWAEAHAGPGAWIHFTLPLAETLPHRDLDAPKDQALDAA